MGTSISAYLLVGVRLDKIVTLRKESKTVTKFNPDTGTPYKKKETVTQEFVGDKQVDDAREYLESLGFEDHPGVRKLGVFNLDDNQFVGVLLEDHDVEYDSSVGEYTVEQLAEHVGKVKNQLLEKLGVTVEPHVYMVSYTSA